MYTVEPHFSEHPWDQVRMFGQLGSVRSPGFINLKVQPVGGGLITYKEAPALLQPLSLASAQSSNIKGAALD